MSGCSITETRMDGVQAVILENEWLKITVLVSKGADIYQFIYKPKNVDVLWKAPWGIKNPQGGIATAENSQVAWMENYEGGWQEIWDCLLKVRSEGEMNPVISIDQAKIFIDGTLSEPRLSHPEGLAFDQEGNLWCGGERGEIYRIDPQGQSLELVANTEGFCLGMAFDRQGYLYVCDNKHASIFRLDTKTRELTRFIDGPKSGIRIPNFPVVDHQRSCLYISDSYQFGEKGPGVWKFDLATGEGSLWYNEPMNFANGMVLSLEGNVLFIAETFGKQISAIPILENGQPREKQFVASVEALPDGLSIDQEGNVYVSCYEPSQLYRIRKDGPVELLIHDPEAHTLCHPTNCAFRGDDLYTTNLGRWHITKFKVGIEGASLL